MARSLKKMSMGDALAKRGVNFASSLEYEGLVMTDILTDDAEDWKPVAELIECCR